jgi:hypothetical protein
MLQSELGSGRNSLESLYQSPVQREASYVVTKLFGVSYGFCVAMFTILRRLTFSQNSDAGSCKRLLHLETGGSVPDVMDFCKAWFSKMISWFVWVLSFSYGRVLSTYSESEAITYMRIGSSHSATRVCSGDRRRRWKVMIEA